MSGLHIVRDVRKAAALLQPSRLAMLDQLHEPDSASGVARKLGLPRQQVNYHLRELEREGFLEFVGERRKGNCNERIVRAKARCFVISNEALGPLGEPAEQAQDRFSAAYLATAAARVIRDLALLAVRAAKAGKRLATMTLETEIRFRSAEQRSEFAAELASSVASLAAKYHDEKAPTGRSFRFLVGCYPSITKIETETGEGALLE